MALCVVMGALAAFGLVSAVWTLWGLLFPCPEGGILICPGKQTDSVRRYLWLREMGLLRCTLLITQPADLDPQWLEEQGIELCTREELAARLGIGAE